MGRAALLLFTVVTSLASGALPAWADFPGRYGGHYMMGGWGGGVFHPLMMLLMIAIIVVLVVLAVRWLGGPSERRAPAGSSAIEILRERFARGEIDREEYEERRKVLEQ